MIKEIKLESNKTIVRMLEGALERAKSGVTQGIAVAETYDSGESGNMFETYDPSRLVAELRYLERDLIDIKVDTRCHVAGEAY